MRNTLTAASIAAFLAGSTLAFPQASSTPADHPPGNPAIKTTEGNNPGAPAQGANSFTEGQAKARIESRGYANVFRSCERHEWVLARKGNEGRNIRQYHTRLSGQCDRQLILLRQESDSKNRSGAGKRLR